MYPRPSRPSSALTQISILARSRHFPSPDFAQRRASTLVRQEMGAAPSITAFEPIALHPEGVELLKTFASRRKTADAACGCAIGQLALAAGISAAKNTRIVLPPTVTATYVMPDTGMVRFCEKRSHDSPAVPKRSCECASSVDLDFSFFDVVVDYTVSAKCTVSQKSIAVLHHRLVKKKPSGVGIGFIVIDGNVLHFASRPKLGRCGSKHASNKSCRPSPKLLSHPRVWGRSAESNAASRRLTFGRGTSAGGYEKFRVLVTAGRGLELVANAVFRVGDAVITWRTRAVVSLWTARLIDRASPVSGVYIADLATKEAFLAGSLSEGAFLINAADDTTPANLTPERCGNEVIFVAIHPIFPGQKLRFAYKIKDARRRMLVLAKS